MAATRQSTLVEPGVTPDHPAHLEDLNADDAIGGFRCLVCGARISIDPQSRVEYGHSRGNKGQRCPHRPESADANGGFGGRR